MIIKVFILYIGIYYNVVQRRCFELPNVFSAAGGNNIKKGDYDK